MDWKTPIMAGHSLGGTAVVCIVHWTSSESLSLHTSSSCRLETSLILMA